MEGGFISLYVYLAEKVRALEINLKLYNKKENWPDKVRKELIGESIEVMDELLQDPLINILLQSGYETASEPDDSIKKVLAGGEALSDFLENERLLLEASGFWESTAASIVEHVKEKLEAGLHGLIPPNEVFEAIVSLKFALIEARGKLRSRWNSIALKLVLGFSGASLIGLNATGWALTLGISGPLTALSSATGGILLGESAKSALKLISK